MSSSRKPITDLILLPFLFNVLLHLLIGYIIIGLGSLERIHQNGKVFFVYGIYSRKNLFLVFQSIFWFVKSLHDICFNIMNSFLRFLFFGQVYIIKAVKIYFRVKIIYLIFNHSNMFVDVIQYFQVNERQQTKKLLNILRHVNVYSMPKYIHKLM